MSHLMISMLFVEPVTGDVCVPWSLECADGGAEAIFAWPLGPQYNGLMGALDGMTGQITGSAEDPGQTRDPARARCCYLEHWSFW